MPTSCPTASRIARTRSTSSRVFVPSLILMMRKPCPTAAAAFRRHRAAVADRDRQARLHRPARPAEHADTAAGRRPCRACRAARCRTRRGSASCSSGTRRSPPCDRRSRAGRVSLMSCARSTPAARSIACVSPHSFQNGLLSPQPTRPASVLMRTNTFAAARISMTAMRNGSLSGMSALNRSMLVMFGMRRIIRVGEIRARIKKPRDRSRNSPMLAYQGG